MNNRVIKNKLPILFILTAILFVIAIIFRNESTISILANGTLISLVFTYFFDEQKQARDHDFEQNKQLKEYYLNSNITHQAFIKLIEFGEKYIGKLYEIYDHAMQHGQSMDLNKFAIELHYMRREYTIYLDKGISEKLGAFESCMSRIGAIEQVQKLIQDPQKREKMIEESLNKFLSLLGKNGETQNSELSIDGAIEGIKELIGIPKIIGKRNNLI